MWKKHHSADFFPFVASCWCSENWRNWSIQGLDSQIQGVQPGLFLHHQVNISQGPFLMFWQMQIPVQVKHGQHGEHPHHSRKLPPCRPASPTPILLQAPFWFSTPCPCDGVPPPLFLFSLLSPFLPLPFSSSFSLFLFFLPPPSKIFNVCVLLAHACCG